MLPVKNIAQSWFPSAFNDFFDTDWLAKVNPTAPSINVLEDEKSYKVEVAAPGLTKDDFKLHIDEDNNLFINMEKQTKDEEKDKEGKKYIRREFSYAKFEQSLALPDNVDREKIGAEVKDGVLTIDLPKKAVEAKPAGHAIEIH